MISATATILMVTIGITTTMNANALNFGLISEDDNTGSVDTDSLFSYIGAAITCINSNQDNNNIFTNDTSEAP